MRLALIPPLGLEHMALLCNTHLILPQELYNTKYDDTYKEACRRGDLTILDNGVNEGAEVTNIALAMEADRLGVTEVVLPDALRKGVLTAHLATKYFSDVFTSSSRLIDHNYMGVLQGINLQEIKILARHFADIPHITTVGIPRHLIRTTRRQSVRIDIATWIADTFDDRFQVHLLGACDSWPREVYWAARYVPFVRSIDTSMPFNYALQGYHLGWNSPTNISRAGDYFTTSKLNVTTSRLADSNVKMFLGWANGSKAPLGELQQLPVE
jgi:hypothetical protein